MTAGAVVADVLRTLLALLFITSSATKLADREAFEKTLSVLHILRINTRASAIAICGVELITGLGLLVSYERAVFDGLALLLGLGFALVGVYARVAGLDVECRCLGPLDRGRLGLGTTIRGAALSGLAVVALLLDGRPDATRFQPDWGHGTVLLAVGCIFALVVWQCTQALVSVREEAQS